MIPWVTNLLSKKQVNNQPVEFLFPEKPLQGKSYHSPAMILECKIDIYVSFWIHLFLLFVHVLRHFDIPKQILKWYHIVRKVCLCHLAWGFLLLLFSLRDALTPFLKHEEEQQSTEIGVSPFHYVLCAATSPAVKLQDETLTYLNQGNVKLLLCLFNLSQHLMLHSKH